MPSNLICSNYLSLSKIPFIINYVISSLWYHQNGLLLYLSTMKCNNMSKWKYRKYKNNYQITYVINTSIEYWPLKLLTYTYICLFIRIVNVKSINQKKSAKNYFRQIKTYNFLIFFICPPSYWYILICAVQITWVCVLPCSSCHSVLVIGKLGIFDTQTQLIYNTKISKH